MYNDTVNLFAARLQREGYPRVNKKDILTTIQAAESQDYSKAFRTKLYTKQGNAYCRILEFINWDKPKLFGKGGLYN